MADRCENKEATSHDRGKDRSESADGETNNHSPSHYRHCPLRLVSASCRVRLSGPMCTMCTCAYSIVWINREIGGWGWGEGEIIRERHRETERDKDKDRYRDK